MNEIITTPDPRLREKSTKVHEITPEIHALIKEMVRLSLDWENPIRTNFRPPWLPPKWAKISASSLYVMI